MKAKKSISAKELKERAPAVAALLADILAPCKQKAKRRK